MESISETQGLGNTAFSEAHKQVLEETNRLRVANQILALMADYLGDPSRIKTLQILDVGCSTGVITAHIARHAGKTVGIDVDKGAIETAQEAAGEQEGLSFRQASGTSIPMGDAVFDVALCNQVYYLASDPAQIMQEIGRVLKRGGICIFTGDNLLYPFKSVYEVPFLHWLPPRAQAWMVRLAGRKQYYVGKYRSYWGQRELFKGLIVHDYTLTILANPEQFQFTNIVRYRKLLRAIPRGIMQLLEPLLPTFVFILQKP